MLQNSCLQRFRLSQTEQPKDCGNCIYIDLIFFVWFKAVWIGQDYLEYQNPTFFAINPQELKIRKRGKKRELKQARGQERELYKKNAHTLDM